MFERICLVLVAFRLDIVWNVMLEIVKRGREMKLFGRMERVCARSDLEEGMEWKL